MLSHEDKEAPAKPSPRPLAFMSSCCWGRPATDDVKHEDLVVETFAKSKSRHDRILHIVLDSLTADLGRPTRHCPGRQGSAPIATLR